GGVAERLAEDGTVLKRLDRTEVERQARALIDQGARNIAVCFLHAYRHDRHERQAKEWIEARFPGLYVCTSAEIWPQQREYERSLVSVINAYVGGRMRSYFDTLAERAAPAGLGCRIVPTN